jgi:hypothetical protein
MQSYKQGEILLENRQYLKAVTYYDRSIRWYIPLNPYVRRSAERLWNIGEIAERKGDNRLALISYRTIRRGFYAVSHVAQPGKKWIERCDKKIDDLMVYEKGEDQKGDASTSERAVFRNEKSRPPSIFWSIVTVVGFLGWVGTVIGFIMFPLRRKQRARSPAYSIFMWTALTVIFFSLWVLGMMNA